MVPPVGGPAIVSVIERRRKTQAEQEILLANNSRTAGQNGFRVRVATHAKSEIDAPVSFVADMRAALPGIAMKKSPYFVQNRYGPFGYAFGRSGTSDLCIYSWQRIRSQSTLLANQGLIDVRLRLCETGATERQLLSVVYGYTIDAFFNDPGWNPYGDTPSPPADMGARGPDVYPLSETRFETVVTPVPASQPAARRKAAKPQAPAAAAVSVPQPSGPLVPPPPSDGAATAKSADTPASTPGPAVPKPPATDD